MTRIASKPVAALLFAATLAASCVSSGVRHHRDAYVVDGSIVAVGAVALGISAFVHAGCDAQSPDCRSEASVGIGAGAIVMFLGAVGALGNWVGADWYPFNWGAPPPSNGWQKPSPANPPVP